MSIPGVVVLRPRIPDDAQARWDAMTDEEKSAAKAVWDEWFTTLYADFGITRAVPK